MKRFKCLVRLISTVLSVVNFTLLMPKGDHLYHIKFFFSSFSGVMVLGSFVGQTSFLPASSPCARGIFFQKGDTTGIPPSLLICYSYERSLKPEHLLAERRLDSVPFWPFLTLILASLQSIQFFRSLYHHFEP